jgi:uncharacterized protein
MKYDYINNDEDDDDDNMFNPHTVDEVGGIESVIKAMNGLLQDKLLPKSVVIKLNNSVEILKNDKEEMQLRINRVQEILNEITEDSNLPSFVKTQIWNISGMLEKV